MTKHILSNYTLLYLNKKLHEKNDSLLLFFGFTAAHPCLFFLLKPLYSVQSAGACSCSLKGWLANTASWSQADINEKNNNSNKI